MKKNFLKNFQIKKCNKSHQKSQIKAKIKIIQNGIHSLKDTKIRLKTTIGHSKITPIITKK